MTRRLGQVPLGGAFVLADQLYHRIVHPETKNTRRYNTDTEVLEISVLCLTDVDRGYLWIAENVEVI